MRDRRDAGRKVRLLSSNLLAEGRQIVAANGDAGYAVGAWPHRVDAELASGRLGDVQRRLAQGDVAGRHHEMDVLARRDTEVGDEIDFRPADDFAGLPIDDGAEELAGA